MDTEVAVWEPAYRRSLATRTTGNGVDNVLMRMRGAGYLLNGDGLL